jgi:hypothetical protein
MQHSARCKPLASRQSRQVPITEAHCVYTHVLMLVIEYVSTRQDGTSQLISFSFTAKGVKFSNQDTSFSRCDTPLLARVCTVGFCLGQKLTISSSQHLLRGGYAGCRRRGCRSGRTSRCCRWRWCRRCRAPSAAGPPAPPSRCCCAPGHPGAKGQSQPMRQACGCTENQGGCAGHSCSAARHRCKGLWL